jgi:hypothetical protein
LASGFAELSAYVLSLPFHLSTAINGIKNSKAPVKQAVAA